MKELSPQEIVNKYALSDDQIADITSTIISTLTYNKTPSENPLAIVVGGQPGSGKTALISFTKQISSNRSFITVDNDFFRGFHPMADEIQKLYPDFFTLATDQLGMGITSNVIDYFVNNNYDLIFHQTLKNNRIGDDAITKFRESGYTVGVRAFAVPFFESNMSQIERYLGQNEKLGYCRYATSDGHKTAYLGLPDTVQYLEENGLYDFMQIYTRSDDIANPNLIYTSFNPQSQFTTLRALKNCENAPRQNNKQGYISAKDAVLKARTELAVSSFDDIQQRLILAENNPYNTAEIQLRADELKSSMALLQNTETLQEQIDSVRQCAGQDESITAYLDDLQEAHFSPLQNITPTYTYIPQPLFPAQ